MLAGFKRTVLSSLIRFLIRPFLGGILPYSFQRQVANAATSICLAPRDMCVDDVVLGGVHCEAVTAGQPAGTTLLWLHGGGYCIGSCRTDRAPAGQFAKSSGARVIVPDYRLAPEHPYPAALDDALAVYTALLETGTPAESIVLGGDSAGGGLALALCLALRERGQPMPAGLVCCSPWVDLRLVQASYESRSADDPWLTKSMLKNWSAAYLAATPATHPACSPLLAELHDLPPVLIQVGDREILLDDAVELDRKLRACGTESRLHVYPHMWHVFFLQAGILDEADAAVTELGAFVRGCCRNTVASDKAA